jgi:hypothetical protein
MLEREERLQALIFKIVNCVPGILVKKHVVQKYLFLSLEISSSRRRESVIRDAIRANPDTSTYTNIADTVFDKNPNNGVASSNPNNGVASSNAQGPTTNPQGPTTNPQGPAAMIQQNNPIPEQPVATNTQQTTPQQAVATNTQQTTRQQAVATNTQQTTRQQPNTGVVPNGTVSGLRMLGGKVGLISNAHTNGPQISSQNSPSVADPVEQAKFESLLTRFDELNNRYKRLQDQVGFTKQFPHPETGRPQRGWTGSRTHLKEVAQKMDVEKKTEMINVNADIEETVRSISGLLQEHIRRRQNVS